VTYAERRLRRIGWAEGRDHKPAAGEAEDLVSDAVEAALSGARVWPEDMDLETFLVGVMWSQAEHRYTKEKRRRRGQRSVDGVEERTTPSDDLHGQRELCAAIEGELASDADLHALFRVMASGAYKPAERAQLLGWSPEHEKVTHRKMNRRLAAAGLGIEPGDIGPQPLPGGRWIRATGDES